MAGVDPYLRAIQIVFYLYLVAQGTLAIVYAMVVADSIMISYNAILGIVISLAAIDLLTCGLCFLTEIVSRKKMPTKSRQCNISFKKGYFMSNLVQDIASIVLVGIWVAKYSFYINVRPYYDSDPIPYNSYKFIFLMQLIFSVSCLQRSIGMSVHEKIISIFKVRKADQPAT